MEGPVLEHTNLQLQARAASAIACLDWEALSILACSLQSLAPIPRRPEHQTIFAAERLEYQPYKRPSSSWHSAVGSRVRLSNIILRPSIPSPTEVAALSAQRRVVARRIKTNTPSKRVLSEPSPCCRYSSSLDATVGAPPSKRFRLRTRPPYPQCCLSPSTE
jgi:hypothetical protein